jgi:hypothetical protein
LIYKNKLFIFLCGALFQKKAIETAMNYPIAIHAVVFAILNAFVLFIADICLKLGGFFGDTTFPALALKNLTAFLTMSGMGALLFCMLLLWKKILRLPLSASEIIKIIVIITTLQPIISVISVIINLKIISIIQLLYQIILTRYVIIHGTQCKKSNILGYIILSFVSVLLVVLGILQYIIIPIYKILST